MTSHADFMEGLDDITAICDKADEQIETGAPDAARLANATCRAGLVLLCGYFEGFVRSLVEEAIDEINDLRIDITRVPDPIFCVVMTSVAESPEKKGVNAVSNLKVAIRRGNSHSIQSKSFSKMEGNPTVDRVERAFAYFGIENVLDGLSIQDFGVNSTFAMDSQVEPLRRQLSAYLDAAGCSGLTDDVLGIFEAKWQAKRKRRDVGYVATIQQMLALRNRIAHGEGRPPITPTELREFCHALEKLSDGLNGIMREVLVKITTFQPRVSAGDAERWNYLRAVE